MVGTQIGPFVLLKLLGAGGMGSVYLAEHSLMKDLHAIKVLDPQLTQNPQIVARFVNEARAAARLRHRNLVRVHNIDRVSADGPWFMVLDYLHGCTLARFLCSQAGPVAPPLVLHVLAQVANCIHHVHAHGVVHRDLKPDNIFLVDHDGDAHFPVVLDLGVAQLSAELASGPVTKTGTVIGTPIYMAPEQLRGERVSPAADIFALGIIAYEMSTGGYFPYQYEEDRSAFFNLPVTEIYYRQRTLAPVDPRQRCGALPDAWVEALQAALDPDPRRRPASAQAFAHMLADAVRGDGHQPEGRTIIRQVARELLHARNSDLDLRGSVPTSERSVVSTACYVPQRSASALALAGDGPAPGSEPISTFTGAASQSQGPARTRVRWALTAAVSSVVVLGVAAISYAIEPAGDRSAVASGSRGDHAATVHEASSPLIPVQRRPAVAPPSARPSELGTAASLSERRPATPQPPSGEVSPDRVAPVAARAPATPAHVSSVSSSKSDRAAEASSDRAPAPGPRDPASVPSPSAPTVRAPRLTTATASKQLGELAIIVRPWALIWLDGKSMGQTPFREKIAAGRHRLRIFNDDLGKDETTMITVAPAQTTTIRRDW